MSGPKVDVVKVLERASTYAAHAAIASRRIANGEVSSMDSVRDAFGRIADGLDLAADARDAVIELVEAAREWCALMPGLAGGPEFDRLRAAAYNIGPQS